MTRQAGFSFESRLPPGRVRALIEGYRLFPQRDPLAICVAPSPSRDRIRI